MGHMAHVLGTKKEFIFNLMLQYNFVYILAFRLCIHVELLDCDATFRMCVCYLFLSIYNFSIYCALRLISSQRFKCVMEGQCF